MSAKRLSERESAVLKILDNQAGRSGSTPTGIFLARTLVNDYGLDASPQGAHQTAASLVRKNLAWRAGETGPRWYRITQPGRDAVRGDMSGQWVVR